MKKLFTAVFILLSFCAYAGKPIKSKIVIPSVTTESLIIFYRPDCPYCQNMNKVLEKSADFTELLQQNFSVQRVNIETEEGRALADQFNIHAVPSIVRFNAASGKNSTIKGFPGITKLAAFLQLDYTPALPVAIIDQTQTVQPVITPTGKVLVGCGDGILQAGETCDDGNQINGDGCSSTCQVQPGYICAGTPSVCTTNCGDGIKAGGESCDDGNQMNGDGCNSTCNIELGYSCTGTTPSNCTATCGDGIKATSESCDDGNQMNGDGCSSVCSIEPGYHCTGTAPSTCTATCGDGIKAFSEACDDGNTTNGDGCSATCTVQAGYTCVGNPSVCSATCGDGIVAGGESCDDGNVVNGDGCSSTCATEPLYTCIGSPSVCVIAPPNDNCTAAIALTGQTGSVPGDNTMATNSSTVLPVSCSSSTEKDLWYKITVGSATTVVFALNGTTMSDPVLAVYSGSCGSLTFVGCDDDSGPGLNSLLTATLPAGGTYYVRVASYNGVGSHFGTFNLTYNITGPYCGDGIVAFNEECDDGNTTNGDGCSSLCKFENASALKGVAINRDGLRADPSSMLDVKSTDGGVLIPRMSSTQRTAIATPAKGLLVFDITTNTFWYYKSGWVEIGATANTGFSAYNGGTQALPGSGNLLPTFPTEQYDDGNHFATPNFTPTETGVYKLDAFVTFTLASSATAYVLTVKIQNSSNGTEFAGNSQVIPAGFAGAIRINVTANTKINAAAPIGILIQNGGTVAQTVSSVTFSGYKVY